MYFIIFLCLFLVDKLLTLYFQNQMFSLCDIFHCGFLMYQFDSDPNYDLKYDFYKELSRMFFTKLIPQIILNTVYYQYLDILSLVSDYSSFLFQLNQFLLLVLSYYFLTIIMNEECFPRPVEIGSILFSFNCYQISTFSLGYLTLGKWLFYMISIS